VSFMLSVIMLNVIMLMVIMLSVIMLSVIMLSVVAPSKVLKSKSVLFHRRPVILLLVVLLLLVPGVVVSADADGLECDEPRHKHYCVTKGHVAKELPPQEPPLVVSMDLGVSVSFFIGGSTVVQHPVVRIQPSLALRR
jgi:hypothetical protein